MTKIQGWTERGDYLYPAPHCERCGLPMSWCDQQPEGFEDDPPYWICDGPNDNTTAKGCGSVQVESGATDRDPNKQRALQQHTPGPWTHKATAGDHDFAIYPEATGRDVALVRDFNEANARLIAAAPEMLEALSTIVKWQNGSPLVGGRGLPPEVADQARAAIEKATHV